MSFDKNLFVNHFLQHKNLRENEKDSRRYSHIIHDYMGVRWGYIQESNLYEETNTGRTLSKVDFDTVQNIGYSETAAAAAGVDGGTDFSRRRATNVLMSATATSIFTLADGGQDPSTWTEFTAHTFTGWQTNAGTAENLNYEVPAALISPEWIAHDDFANRHISVVAPPYAGLKSDGTYNRVSKVEFFLNGGAATTVTTPDSTVRGYDAYSVKHPYAPAKPGAVAVAPGLTINEVRAVVYYQRGIPRVLQGIAEFDGGYNADSGGTASNVVFKTKDRGCFIGKYTDYYIAPTGSDSNNGTSIGTAKLTYGNLYDTAYETDGIIALRINNSFTKSVSSGTGPNAIYAGCSFATHAQREGRRFRQDRGGTENEAGDLPGGASGDYVDRKFLPPIVRGGDFYWNNSQQFKTYGQAVQFKNCNLFINAGTAGTAGGNPGESDNGDNLLFRNKNAKNSANFRFADFIGFVVDGCTAGYGPRDYYSSSEDTTGNSFGEVFDHSYATTVGGIAIMAAEASSTIGDGCVNIYNSNLRYVSMYNAVSSNLVDTTVLAPATVNDVSNASVICGCTFTDVGTMIYPFGSIGGPSAGASAGYATVAGFGQGIPKGATAVSFMDARAIVTAALIDRTPNNNAPTQIGVTGEEQPFDVGFWPDYSYAQSAYKGISMDNVARYTSGYWADKTRAQKPRDPHFDIMQFNRPISNVMFANNVMDGPLGDYQGVFWSDESNVEVGSVFNTTAIHPANVGSINLIGFGSVDENRHGATIPTGRFMHYGPNLNMDEATTSGYAFRDFSSNSLGNNVKDCWFYDQGLEHPTGQPPALVNYIDGFTADPDGAGRTGNVVLRNDYSGVTAAGATEVAYTQVPFDLET